MCLDLWIGPVLLAITVFDVDVVTVRGDLQGLVSSFQVRFVACTGGAGGVVVHCFVVRAACLFPCRCRVLVWKQQRKFCIRVHLFSLLGVGAGIGGRVGVMAAPEGRGEPDVPNPAAAAAGGPGRVAGGALVGGHAGLRVWALAAGTRAERRLAKRAAHMMGERPIVLGRFGLGGLPQRPSVSVVGVTCRRRIRAGVGPVNTHVVKIAVEAPWHLLVVLEPAAARAETGDDLVSGTREVPASVRVRLYGRRLAADVTEHSVEAAPGHLNPEGGGG